MSQELRRHVIAAGNLSALAREAGVDRSQLQRFAKGERNPTLATVDRLCQALGLELRRRD